MVDTPKHIRLLINAISMQMIAIKYLTVDSQHIDIVMGQYVMFIMCAVRQIIYNCIHINKIIISYF